MTAPCRVLLVEDNDLVRDSLSELIDAFGHVVTGVADAEAALEALQADDQRFDVMISDLSLPKMSGLDLARHVKDHHPHIRLVLATGYGSLIDGSKLGFEITVLPKPIDIDRLAAYLDDVAASRNDAGA
jgi:DNA-binding NtrC family response regulator